MAQQTINIGTQANDRQGDPLRTAFQKINNNFSELYTLSDSNQYRLPTASTTILGGVKVDGTTIVINGQGVISSTGELGGGVTSYNDLTDKPSIPTSIFDLDVPEVSVNLPGYLYYSGTTLSWESPPGVTSYNDLTDKPSIPTVSTAGTSGSYNDLIDRPALFSGAYADLTDKPALFSGNYTDLTNKPTIPTVSTAGVSGDYNDLINKPTIPTQTSQLSNDSGFLTTVGWTAVTDKPSFATVATSGSYNDLSNKPAIPVLTGYATESWVQSQGYSQGVPTNEITNTSSEGPTYSVSVGTDGVVTMNTARGGLEFGALPEPGGPTHLHIMRSAGDNGTDLYFGDDYNYVLQRPTAYGGAPAYGVEIGANDNNGGDQQVWRFGTDGDLTAPGNIILNNPVTTTTETVTGTVADSTANPFTFRILKADNPQLVIPFADPNFVLKWTGSDAGSVAAGTQAPGGQGASSLVSEDATYWNFNSWFGLNIARPNSGTVFTVEYGAENSNTTISTTATNLVIEADTKQYKFGTDGNITLPAGGDITFDSSATSYVYGITGVEFADGTTQTTAYPGYLSWSISASGFSSYVFSGPGIETDNTENPILYLYRGFTYKFINTTGGSHPLVIRVSNGGAAYTSGVSGSQTGTQTFTVPMNAPSTLYYQCSFHSGMGNVINIV